MITVQLPDKRTITVQTNDPQEAAMAGRRLLAREAILRSGLGGGRKDTALGQAATGGVGGVTLGGSNVLDAATNAGITGVKNLLMRAQGQTPTYGMADAYAADRGLLKDQAAAHPVANTAGGLLGGFAMPGAEQLGGLVAKGLPAAAEAVKGVPGVGGLLSGLLASKAVPAVALRGAAAGVPLGAVSGAANANPGQGLQGAQTGATVGGLTGGAIPVAAGLAGKVGQGVGNVATAGVRALNKATGGTMLDAAKTAGARLTAALKADGANPAELRSIQNEWLKTGASSPTVMDLATKLPSGGQNTMRLLTGASLKGAGAGKAQSYAADTAAALPDNAMALARNLTPETRPAAVVAKELQDTQGNLAQEQYKAPYETPMTVTPEITGAIADAPGRNAIQGAIDTAIARQDYASADRLKGLLTVHQNAPIPVSSATNESDLSSLQAAIKAATAKGLPLTAGDVDRIRLNLGEAGEGAMRGTTPNRGAAGGMFQRAGQLNSALDAVPEIQPPRQVYKGMQGQRDALEAGQGALSAMPDDYDASIAAALAKATPAENPHQITPDDILGSAGVGVRQAMTDALGTRAAGSTGTMTNLVRAPNLVRNVDTTYGSEEGQNFRDALQNELEKLRNARTIDPSTNSSTFRRADADNALSDISIPARPTVLGLALGAINKVRQGATLSDPERAAVVHLGLSTPDSAALDQFEPDPQKLLDLLHQSGALASLPVAQFAAGNSQ